jgi:demethylmenaquinone methyltransferase / 2-methoxy-6-polyprenyl-1,4-benzoquinol methylase
MSKDIVINPQNKKSELVAGMFNSIAPKYDFLNHFLSLNVDKLWRRKAIQFLGRTSPESILDLATGTGDLAIASLTLHPARVVGLDISENMLLLGKKKALNHQNGNVIEFMLGNAENIPFEDCSFHSVISGFGVRNFSSLEKGLSEAYRVLKDDGQIVILEFSKPSSRLAGSLYRFYFSKVLPLIGGWVSGVKQAYTYLPQSVASFPEGDFFLEILKSTGFKNCSLKRMTFGIATIYSGFKL